MAVWTFPCSNVQCLPTSIFAARVADLTAGIPLVDDCELASVPFGLVFEHGAELSPACVPDTFVQAAFRLLPVVTARVFNDLPGMDERENHDQRPQNRCMDPRVDPPQRAQGLHNSLNHLWWSEMLFVYLNPPAGVLAPERIKSTTNSLEGGINAQLKLLARTHRGRSGERQRRMLDWWLYLKTELPDDPVRIARQSDWGQGQLAKVSTLTQTENQADHETGRPALYDNAIDTDYTHSIGIQKGQI